MRRSVPLPNPAAHSNHHCQSDSSSAGSTSPVTQVTNGSAANSALMRLSHEGWTTTSSSVNATISPFAARRPQFRAYDNPGRGSVTSRTRGSLE